MTCPLPSRVPIGITLLLLGFGFSNPNPDRPQSKAAAEASGVDSAAFIPNRGQWDFPASYVARLGPMTVFLEERGWIFTLAESEDRKGRIRGVNLRLRFVGDEKRPETVGLDSLPGYYNYFLGDDPARWRSEVPGYASVRYSGLYPGVDLLLRENSDRLEYDLLLEPGAALEQIQVEVQGADSLRLASDGSLVMETSFIDLYQPPPTTWELTPTGEKRPLACRYVLLGRNRFGFSAPGRHLALAMVVDPKLDYSTYLGGASADKVYAVATNTSFVPTVAGLTSSYDFPTTTGAFSTKMNGAVDVFVTRFDQVLSTPVYSTYLGGKLYESVGGIAVDGSDAAIVVGSTNSTDFPVTTGAYQTKYGGGPDDCFITRLDKSGGKLLYSTYLGGYYDEAAHDVAVYSNGVATLTGGTHSINFPTTPGAYQRYFGGGTITDYDAFVTRINATGNKLVYSTFLGKSNHESGKAVALGFGATATVVGVTNSPYFPTTVGAYDTTYGGGGQDAFVTRLDAVGGSLVFSTYLGGKTFDTPRAVAVDATGRTTVTGQTNGNDFPTTSMAWDRSFNGSTDVFVSRLGSLGKTLVYSTLMGGWSHEEALDLALAPNGEAILAGWTVSLDFPTTTGAWDRTLGGPRDAFVARLAANGRRFHYSTLLGGGAEDRAHSVVVIKRLGPAFAFVAGETSSTDFPTTSQAYQTTRKGSTASFVTQITPAVSGIRYYGESTPACLGPQRIYALNIPESGKPFGYGCDAAPPNALGMLVLGLKGLDPGYPWIGLKLAVDLSWPWFPFWVRADKNGFNVVIGPVPANSKGLKVFGQYLWANTASCGGVGTLSCSDALEVTVQ